MSEAPPPSSGRACRLACRRGARAALPLLLGLAVACRTAPPPAETQPPPPPAEPSPSVPAPEPGPRATVEVTSKSLNLRAAPSTSSRVLAKARRGERLTVVDERSGWLQVDQGETRGWVSAAYVRRLTPCAADRAEPELLSEPVVSFSDGPGLGRVVVEASVDAGGAVVATRVTENTTKDEALASQAEQEARQLRFRPPVRDCRPRAFVYVYTRSF